MDGEGEGLIAKEINDAIVWSLFYHSYVEGGGLEAPLSFKMTQWSCYCIGESVCYSGWRKEILWTRDGEGLTTRDDKGLH